MRILIFSTAYLPLVGGAEIAVKEITDRIDVFEFDLITARINPKLPQFERLGKINVHRLGFGIKLDKFLLPIFGLVKAITLDNRFNYQLIWSIMASQASIAAVFLKILNPDKKLLLTLQEGDEEEHLKRYVLKIDFLYRLIIKPWHLLVFKRANYLTTISQALKKRALANGVSSPIEIVPNGVDFDKFCAKGGPATGGKVQSSKLKVDELKQKLEIRKDEKVVITVSRLVEKNAVGDLIEAIAILKNQRPKLKLLIIGEGELEQSLKLKVKNLKLEEQVLFLGKLLHDEVPKFLAVSDVFVRPSLSEGLGNVFLEAMAVGLPVVGTPVGGIVDFLQDGKTGLFCQVHNPKSIAEKIKLLLNDDNLRQKIINNAKKLVKNNYSWDLISQKMNHIFNQLSNLSQFN